MMRQLSTCVLALHRCLLLRRLAASASRCLSSSSPSPATSTKPSGQSIVVESLFGKDLATQEHTLIEHLWKDACVWDDKKFLVSA